MVTQLTGQPVTGLIARLEERGRETGSETTQFREAGIYKLFIILNLLKCVIIFDTGKTFKTRYQQITIFSLF